jgi:hypothetical protein
MNTGKRERVGITEQELMDSWGGSEPVQSVQAMKAPPEPIDIVDPTPPPGSDAPPNNATVTPPTADNNLVLFGGLAAFYLVALAPMGRRKVSGIPGPSWLLPGLLLAGGLAWFAFKKPDTGGELQVLDTWVDINKAAGEDAEAIKAIFTRMTPAEVHDCYRYVTEFITQGIQLPQEDPLWTRIIDISKKYQIFT